MEGKAELEGDAELEGAVDGLDDGSTDFEGAKLGSADTDGWREGA